MTASTPPSGNGYPSHPPSGPSNPSPTAELTALAAHLRRVADRLDDLDTRCAQRTDNLVENVQVQLAELRRYTDAQLGEQADQVQQLLDTLTAHSPGPTAWATADAEQAARVWQDLSTWIDETFVPWYEITRDQLPDCWALHRRVVIELIWLHDAYRAAHRPGAAPHLSADWHTRWQPAALRTIHDAVPRRGVRVCGPGHHLTHEADRLRNRPTDQDLHVRPHEKVLVTAQLAERRHWLEFYEQAVTADLGMRQSAAMSGFLA